MLLALDGDRLLALAVGGPGQAHEAGEVVRRVEAERGALAQHGMEAPDDLRRALALLVAAEHPGLLEQPPRLHAVAAVDEQRRLEHGECELKRGLAVRRHARLHAAPAVRCPVHVDVRPHAWDRSRVAGLRAPA